MNIYDTIQADQIERGDQIIIDGDPVEVDNVNDSDDINEIIIHGFSHVSGDAISVSLPFDYSIELWAV